MKPYVSSRSGRLQWTMQRVSAILLLFLAGSHFFIQHFTAEAVSAGLTVAARFDDRFFQAYYVVFIALALYHGVNGLMGILYDYCPRQMLRAALTWTIWSATAFFLVIAIANIIDAPKLGDVKQWYTTNGFAAGESAGNPPTLPKHYDFRQEMRELHLLGFYLEHHTHGAPDDLAAVFGNSGVTAADEAAATELAAAGGTAFERWARRELAAGLPAQEERDRDMIFSSTYEFAVWALHVRRTNAEERGDEAVARRLADLPAYSPNLH